MMLYIFLHVVLHHDLIQEGNTSPCLKTHFNPEDVPSVPFQTVDLDEGSLPTDVPATDVRVKAVLYNFFDLVVYKDQFCITSEYTDSLIYMILSNMFLLNLHIPFICFSEGTRNNKDGVGPFCQSPSTLHIWSRGGTR